MDQSVRNLVSLVEVSDMSRPREFDETEVMDKALELFWRQGYEGTSLNDLLDATGLTKSSLYAAFGSKEDLFHRS
ncbi:TetR/AcrR family transcriptional regulator [Bradyrhizobium sp. RDM12]